MGHYLVRTAPGIYDVSCTYFPGNKKHSVPYVCGKHHLDISDRAAVMDIIKKAKPNHVIHTASIADVDYVEKNKKEAEMSNLGGTKNVIEACREVNAGLVYTSSNAVFDGKNPPYSEDDPVNPLSYYGELKIREEELVKKSGLEYAIVRPILMYGWNLGTERKNPVTWLIDLLRTGREVNMVDDIFCNPLFVEDCTKVIWEIIRSDRKGLFHVGGENEISRYEFARLTADVFGFDTNCVKPVKNSFFAEIAPRPRNTTYCINKIKRELRIFPLGAREGLEAMRGAGHETS